MSSNNSDEPKTRGPFTRALLWTLRPGFGKRFSANPLSGLGSVSERFVVAPLSLHRRRRRESKKIEQILASLDVDPVLRDRFIFEVFVKFYGHSSTRLAKIHQHVVAQAYRRVLLALLSIWLIWYVSTHFHFEQYFLFRLFWNSPLLIMILAAPVVFTILFSVVRDLFFAYCIRQRRHGSIDAFLLWVTSPEEWFSSILAPHIKPNDLPPDLQARIHDIDFEEV